MRPRSSYWEEVRKGAEQGRQKQEAAERAVAEFRASSAARRRAVEEQDLRAREAAAAREALKHDRAAKAAETRKQQEEELLERTEAERRRTETDAALLAGKDPDLIPYSVRGVTAAQVRARQIELARLQENRGKPWAELALDREILRLVQAGVDRPTIVRQLGVGAHRVARVRRAAGLKSRRFKRAVPGPESEPTSRSLPNSDASTDRPTLEDDRPRRPPRKEETDEFGDPVHPDGAENDWAWSDENDEDPRRRRPAPE